jgi:hypothetical protein
MTGRERERETSLSGQTKSFKVVCLREKISLLKTLDLFEFGSTHSQKKEACPTLNFQLCQISLLFCLRVRERGWLLGEKKGKLNLTLVVPLIFEAASSVPKLCFGYRRSGSSCSSALPPPTATHNISCSSQQRQCSKLSSASQTKTTNYNY